MRDEYSIPQKIKGQSEKFLRLEASDIVDSEGTMYKNPFSHHYQDTNPKNNMNQLAALIKSRLYQTKDQPVTVVLYGQTGSGKSAALYHIIQNITTITQAVPGSTYSYTAVQWYTKCEIKNSQKRLIVDDILIDLLNPGAADPTNITTTKSPTRAKDNSILEHLISNHRFKHANGTSDSSVIFFTCYKDAVPILSVVELPGNDAEVDDTVTKADDRGNLESRGIQLSLKLFYFLLKNKQKKGIMMSNQTVKFQNKYTIDDILFGIAGKPLEDFFEDDRYIPEILKLYGAKTMQYVTKNIPSVTASIGFNKTQDNTGLSETSSRSDVQDLYGFPRLKDNNPPQINKRTILSKRMKGFLTSCYLEAGGSKADSIRSFYDLFKKLMFYDDAVLGILNNPSSKLIFVATAFGTHSLAGVQAKPVTGPLSTQRPTKQNQADIAKQAADAKKAKEDAEDKEFSRIVRNTLYTMHYANELDLFRKNCPLQAVPIPTAGGARTRKKK
jgi:hypothetical protein